MYCFSLWPAGALCTCAVFVGCIIWGSFSAAHYVNYQNTRSVYTSTICLLLNYTVVQHTRQYCSSNVCASYTCFDERFLVTYPISNNTYITSVFSSFDEDKPYQQSQV
jgi:hypothetical protein